MDLCQPWGRPSSFVACCRRGRRQAAKDDPQPHGLPIATVVSFQVLGLYESPVLIRSPVAEELPGLAHFRDPVEVQVGRENLVLVA